MKYIVIFLGMMLAVIVALSFGIVMIDEGSALFGGILIAAALILSIVAMFYLIHNQKEMAELFIASRKKRMNKIGLKEVSVETDREKLAEILLSRGFLDGKELFPDSPRQYFCTRSWSAVRGITRYFLIADKLKKGENISSTIEGFEDDVYKFTAEAPLNGGLDSIESVILLYFTDELNESQKADLLEMNARFGVTLGMGANRSSALAVVYERRTHTFFIPGGANGIDPQSATVRFLSDVLSGKDTERTPRNKEYSFRRKNEANRKAFTEKMQTTKKFLPLYLLFFVVGIVMLFLTQGNDVYKWLFSICLLALLAASGINGFLISFSEAEKIRNCVVTGVNILLFAWFLFLPSRLWCFVALCVNVVLAIYVVVVYLRAYIKNMPDASVFSSALSILLIALFLMISIEPYSFVDEIYMAYLLVPTVIVAAVGALVCYLCFRKFAPDLFGKKSVIAVAFMLLFFASYVVFWVGTVHLNALTSPEPTVTSYEVVDKKSYSDDEDKLYVMIDGKECGVEVSSSVYENTQIGDLIELKYYQGGLKIPFYTYGGKE